MINSEFSVDCFQKIVDAYCGASGLPPCSVEINNTYVPDNHVAVYYSNFIMLYDEGFDLNTLLHELAHHDQSYSSSGDDLDHGVNFNKSKDKIERFVLFEYDFKITIED